MGSVKGALQRGLKDGWGWCLLRIAVTIFTVFGNPLGIGDATSEHTRGMFTRLLAPFYGDVGQRHVSAVVITDDAAERIAGAYPMPFEAHARILRRILCLDPAGVLIDLNFRYVRGDEQGLAALSDALSYRSGPQGCGSLEDQRLRDPAVAPVLLAIVRNEASHCPSILDADREGCAFMAPLAVLTRKAQPVDVTGLMVKGQYTLAEETAGRHRRSPALILVAALCARARLDDATCRMAETAWPPMVLRWGYYLSPVTIAHYSNLAPCALTPSDQPSLRTRLVDFLHLAARELSYALSGGIADRAPAQPCAYTDQVTADAFLGPAVNSDAFLRKLIKDRIVVYGADITALPDRITSPVHGVIPGLYAHAMAVDNLLTLGSAYWREPPEVFATVDASQLVEFGFALLLLLGGSWAAGMQWRWRAAWLIGFALFVWLTGAGLVWILAWAPPNCVLMTTISIADQLVDRGDRSKSESGGG